MRGAAVSVGVLLRTVQAVVLAVSLLGGVDTLTWKQDLIMLGNVYNKFQAISLKGKFSAKIYIRQGSLVGNRSSP